MPSKKYKKGTINGFFVKKKNKIFSGLEKVVFGSIKKIVTPEPLFTFVN